MHPLLAWIVMREEEAYPGQFVARLATDVVTPYVLLADTLRELRPTSARPGPIRSSAG
jgi:hypothetical protein